MSALPDEAEFAAPVPVFVDATGRRGRLIRRGTIAMLGIIGAYGLAVVLSFLGGPVPPNALLPFPDLQSAAPSNPASANPNGQASKGGANATHAGSGTGGSTGAAPLSGPSGAPASSPAPSASPAASVSPSPTGNRHVPPGHASRSASPGPTNGHGH